MWHITGNQLIFLLNFVKAENTIVNKFKNKWSNQKLITCYYTKLVKILKLFHYMPMFRIAIYTVGKQIFEKFMTIEQKYTIILNLDELDALNNENCGWLSYNSLCVFKLESLFTAGVCCICIVYSTEKFEEEEFLWKWKVCKCLHIIICTGSDYCNM
jgi:hypothetical protein